MSAFALSLTFFDDGAFGLFEETLLLNETFDFADDALEPRDVTEDAREPFDFFEETSDLTDDALEPLDFTEDPLGRAVFADTEETRRDE